MISVAPAHASLLVRIRGAAETQYPVIVGDNAIAEIPRLLSLSKYSHTVVITDPLVSKHWSEELLRVLGAGTEVIEIGSGEKHKTLATAELIWIELVRLHIDRHSLIVNLGGGVVGDLGGFAASCFMRGIDFVQVPTTVLAQVDASVGGKVGIDFVGIKNLIGNFQQPKVVICDTRTLATLPPREFLAGFAEMAKHGLITDRHYFERVISSKPLELTPAALTPLIFDSIQIKAAIVADDERERGRRKLLNFGHTIGHAIEAALLESEALLHGEAISIGMVAEAKLSVAAGKLSPEAVIVIEKGLQFLGLPTTLKRRISADTLIQRMEHDKKNRGAKIKWVLLDEIGRASFDHDLPESVVRDVLSTLGPS